MESECENAGTEYNEMVHISDWFRIIENIAGIDSDKSMDTEADDDDDVFGDGLDLWPDICHRTEGAVQREVITHFELIDANDRERGLKASYIRTRDWKLLVNSSLSFVEIPSNKYWVHYDAEYTEQPPKEVYDAMQSEETLSALYASQCFEDFGDGQSGAMFEYDEVLLFAISNDHIEACNVAPDNPQIVRELMDRLLSDDNIDEYVRWNQDTVELSKQGALAQIESYDCDQGKSYHVSWHEMEAHAIEDAVELSWTEIFQSYIDTVDECDWRNAVSAYLGLPVDGGDICVLMTMSVILSMLSYLWVMNGKLREVDVNVINGRFMYRPANIKMRRRPTIQNAINVNASSDHDVDERSSLLQHGL